MAETVGTKPAFRDAFNRGQRCIVPVDGFYEWQKREGGKQPYATVGADGKPLALEGLWDQWKEPDSGQAVYTYTIIKARIILLPLIMATLVWRGRCRTEPTPVVAAGKDLYRKCVFS